MKLPHLCPACFAHNEGDSCPHCGHVRGNEGESPLYLRPGTELKGRYALGRVLGHGGFGITYLAYDRLNDGKVAVKEYFPADKVTRAPGCQEVSLFTGVAPESFRRGVERFIDEARTLVRFRDHDGIVTVEDFFHENGTAYMVMEYIDGETLSVYLEKRGILPFAEALNLLEPIFDALEAMHAAGVLHRDIKPSNIILRPSGGTVLLDFGAARQFAQEGRDMSAIVSDGYSPLEQYYAGGDQRAWTDVYALGATLYRMLTGLLLPTAVSRTSQDDYAPPSAAGRSVPSAVDRAISKALAVHGSGRWASVAEFRRALTGAAEVTVKADMPDEGHLAATPMSCPHCQATNYLSPLQSAAHTLCHSCGNVLLEEKDQSRRSRRRRWPAAAIAVTVLAALCATYVLFAGDAGGRKEEKPAATAQNTALEQDGSRPAEGDAPGSMPIQTSRIGSDAMAARQADVYQAAPRATPPSAAQPPAIQAPKTQPPPAPVPPAEPAEVWDTDPRGIKVANSGTRPGEVVSWSGGAVEGYADGSGILSYLRNGVLQRQIRGTWARGRLTEGSRATVVYPDREIAGTVINGIIKQ